jgi:hypothetical protein
VYPLLVEEIARGNDTVVVSEKIEAL